MKLAFRTSLICGALPLVVGVAIFVLWLITRWHWLMMAGLFTIYGGLVVVAIGVLALVRFWWLARRAPDVGRPRLWRSIAACAILLLSNFPVAAGITVAAVSIATSYKVVVHNASRETLVEVRLVGGGCDEALGSIPPGGRGGRRLWFRHDGTLELRASSAKGTFTETIEGYVTNNMGGRATVTVNEDGTISVSRKGA